MVRSLESRITAASVFGAIRQTSAPSGISMADQPDLSTTRRRVAAEQKDRRSCAASVISPSVIRVDPGSMDLSEGAPARKLDLGVDMQRVLSGEVSAVSEPARAFAFEVAE